MDEDHKHCIIDMDPNLRDAIDRFRETNHISSWSISRRLIMYILVLIYYLFLFVFINFLNICSCLFFDRAQEYGNYKADKGNGVIVVQLSGSASASRNMQTNKKYLTYRGGIRLVLIRTSTDENGTQFLQAKGSSTLFDCFYSVTLQFL